MQVRTYETLESLKEHSIVYNASTKGEFSLSIDTQGNYIIPPSRREQNILDGYYGYLKYIFINDGKVSTPTTPAETAKMMFEFIELWETRKYPELCVIEIDTEDDCE